LRAEACGPPRRDDSGALRRLRHHLRARRCSRSRRHRARLYAIARAADAVDPGRDGGDAARAWASSTRRAWTSSPGQPHVSSLPSAAASRRLDESWAGLCRGASRMVTSRPRGPGAGAPRGDARAAGARACRSSPDLCWCSISERCSRPHADDQSGKVRHTRRRSSGRAVRFGSLAALDSARPDRAVAPGPAELARMTLPRGKTRYAQHQ
jgi:hypothetical protein